MKLVERLKNRLMYPAALTYVSWQSRINRLKSFGKKDKVIFAELYAGQKIMLMALYEKGRIREDVVAAMATAKAQGVYVIGVNTLKLGVPENYKSCMSCYIERYNFGRDFGSYKSGFEYVYANGLAEKCPVLLMINDSVFFSKKHTAKFIDDMLEGGVEVLGSTENFEIEHHLGSFCIAMKGSVLNNIKLKQYWRAYKCTDVRPVVIKTGEMELSKTLKRIVSSSEEFRSLYDAAHAAGLLQNDAALLNSIAELSRSSEFTECPKFNFASVSENILDKYLHNSAELTRIGVNVDVNEISTLHMQFVSTLSEFNGFMHNSITNSDKLDGRLCRAVKEEALSSFITYFKMGSQIHQNGIFLHKIGLPIIKLDGIYRGMFNARDVERIANDLEPDQQEAFRRIMYSRPYGRAVLFGWKRAAFERGLI